jgi:hypothetical protein
VDAAFFQPHVGTRFAVAGGTLLLVDVSLGSVRDGAPRAEPFTLTFTGSPEQALPQGTHELEHVMLGSLALFLVPRQPVADGLPRYDATFN